MANKKSSISAEVKLSGANAFKSGLNDLGKNAKSFGKTMGEISGNGGRGAGRFTEILSGINLVGMASRNTGAVMRKAFSEDLSIEQLAMGLAAVSNGTETLSEQFKGLREAAQLPGLGFTEMAKGSLTLQAVGVGAKESRDMIVQVGNALATVGKGKNELDAITDALAKMAGKGSVTEEHLNIIAERYPAIRSIAQTLDKSSPAKFMSGLSEALSKLPRATGTAQDGIDNLSDAVSQFTATKSGGAFNDYVKIITEGLSKAVSKSDSLKEAFNELKQIGYNAASLKMSAAESPLAKYELSPEEIEKRKQLRISAAEEESKKKEAVLQSYLELSKAEVKLQDAKASKDKDRILWATEELAILNERKKLIEELGISEERATGHIKTRIGIELDGINSVEEAEKQLALTKARKKELDDIKLMGIESPGISKRKKERVSSAIAVERETQRLQDEGFSPDEAKSIAERKGKLETQSKRDEERAQAGLRPRIRTKTKEETERARFERLSPEELNRLEGLKTGETAFETFQRKQKGGINAGRDDAMVMRPYGETNLRKTIKGVGSKKKTEESKLDDSQGIGANIGTLVNAMMQVKAAVEKIAPNASERGKPSSSGSR